MSRLCPGGAILIAALVGFDFGSPVNAAPPSWSRPIGTTFAVGAKPNAAISAASPHVPADGWVPRSECFPIERLSPEQRNEAEALLLKLLDGEGLYTVVTGLKPVSSGFWVGRFRVDQPDLTELERIRTILNAFRCGEVLMADVRVFQRVYEGQRSAEAYVAHRPALAAKIIEYPDFFKPRGVTANSSPVEVMTLIELAEEPDRWRGQGYVYGYPREAVEFFVAAGLADRQAGRGSLTPRRFVSIPTFAAETGRFVYAVDVNAPETDEDRRLRTEATLILADYRRRRALLSPTDRTEDRASLPTARLGVVELLRDWFDDGWGRCHPDHARRNLGRPPRRLDAAPSVKTWAWSGSFVAPIAPSPQR
ncbi:hypothetical protein [Isosphaera pallida]|uniref:hypothetical protein n=1 Tax=Isosphaera pallida TaxID=128 RepID=UPI00069483DD|nr:hypothetical protein [Isosphaera pallida]